MTEYILRAQQNLEKALNVLLINKPKTSFDLSPFQGDYNILNKYNLKTLFRFFLDNY